MFDVAIAGGGPAGSSAALVLARAGFDVLLIERATFPRVKACGEYLNAGAVAQLKRLGVAGSLVTNAMSLDGIRLCGNGVRAELRFSQPGCSIPRAMLDDALFRAAANAGAKIIQGRVEDVHSSTDDIRTTVRIPDGSVQEIQARFMVGADGAHSIVSKKCGLTVRSRGPARFALGGHYTDFAGLEPFVEMFVEGSSYFAVNPFDAAHANVMVIVRESDLAARRDDVDRFIRERAQRLSGNPFRFQHAHLEGKRIAIGPLAHRTRALHAGRVVLAGDAAGFIDPFTGQGVYVALVGGQAAAQSIAAALRAPQESQSLLERYGETLQLEMAQRARLAAVVRSFVRSPILSKRAARNLERDPARAQPLIDAIAGSAPAAPALSLRNLARLVA